MKWSKRDDLLFRKWTKERVPAEEIARDLGRTVQAIYSRRRQVGVRMPPKAPPRKRLCAECGGSFVPWRVAGLTLSQRCRGCSKQGALPTLSRKARADLVRLYKGGMCSLDLAEMFGITRRTVARYAKAAGVSRKRGRRPA